MTKDFAVLKAAQRLDHYLRREFSRLDDGIGESDPALQAERLSRIAEVNELSDTLNELFGTLSGSLDEKLFLTYAVQKEVEKTDELHSEVFGVTEAIGQTEKGETVASAGTTAILSPAQQRAEQMLKEYSETSPRDVALYLSENDCPSEVLPGVPATTSTLPESDSDNGVKQTIEGVQFEGIEPQIVDGKTTLENGAEKVSKGTDIRIDDYLSKNSLVVTGLIDADIKRLQPDNREHEPANVVE